ncbi:MAG: DedA family protein, partial [Ilumatobacteraceae bacterium]
AMVDWAADVIDAIGLVGVAFLIALESIIPPIPSELVLLLTGFNVHEQRFGLVPAILLATVGSVIGAVALYAVGALISEERLERLLTSIGRFVGLKRTDIDRGFRWFERHGPAVVFFGRLIPVVRSMVSIPAGADRMKMLPFLAYTTAGSLLWNTIWILVGRQLGSNWRDAEKWSELIELVALAGMGVVVVVLVIRARRRRA